MSREPARPTRALLKGMPYTPAAATDVRKTWARWLAQQAQPQTNVAPMRRSNGK